MKRNLKAAFYTVICAALGAGVTWACYLWLDYAAAHFSRWKFLLFSPLSLIALQVILNVFFAIRERLK